MLAPDLRLPLETVTETVAILGKRGAGKTSTARVLVEELVDAGLPVLVIDPTGVWWGLRASADGLGPGRPVVIIGGEHADVPLVDTAGAAVADVMVDQRIPAVLDLSLLSKTSQRRLVLDLLERLYHRNREALHVVIDEADLFAPERASHGMERLLGAMDDLVRRGRVKGLGTTLITQRPASLSKSVLGQAEMLIALRVIGARDVSAINDWVSLHAQGDEARELKASLPSLPVGTAWVWSPGWLEILQKVAIRRPETFDSSATPKPGERPRKPNLIAPAQIERLRADLASLLPPQDHQPPPAAGAPTRTRSRAGSGARGASVGREATSGEIARLRDQVAQLQDKLRAASEPRVVQVPVLADDERRLLVDTSDQLDQVSAALATITSTWQQLRDRLAASAPAPQPASASATSTAFPAATSPAASPAAASASRAGASRAGASRAQPATAAAPGTAAEGSSTLPKAQRLILTALAQHGPLHTRQIAVITGYSAKSGGYRNALSALRSAGNLDGHGTLSITTTGTAALGEYAPLPTGSALLAWWQTNILGKAERLILDVLAHHWPAPVPVQQIADEAGYSASSGGFRNALSRLRGLELASGRGELVLAPTLADDPSAKAPDRSS